MAKPAPTQVDVPEWSGFVHVRMLSGTERDTVFSGLGKNADGAMDLRDYRARLVAAATVDEAGIALFTRDEVAALDDTHAAAVLRLFDAAQRINRLRPADLEAAQGN
jgi:hypothetical protein